MALRLAPIPIWFFRDNSGNPLVGGTLSARDADNPSQYKTIYKNLAGEPYPEPAVFDGAGALGPIYFDDATSKYELIIRDSSGELVDIIPYYPVDGGGGGTPVTVNQDFDNYFINSAFRYYTQPSGNLTAGETSIAAGKWYVKKNNATGTDTLTFVETTPSSYPPIYPPDNPPIILEYVVGGVPVGETQKDIVQRFPAVKSFSDEIVTVSFYARDTIGNIGQVVYQRYFGDGSPTVESAGVYNFTFPTGNFDKVEVNFTIPALPGGATVTTNDYIDIGIRLPLNTTGTFEFTDLYLKRSLNSTSLYPFATDSQTRYRVLEDIKGDFWFSTGDTKWSYNPNQSGWLPLANGKTIGDSSSNSTYAGDTFYDLFVVLWTNTSDLTCPLLTSAGAPTVRTTSALDDWNLNKRLTLPEAGGRVTINAFGGETVGTTIGNDFHKLVVGDIPQMTPALRFGDFDNGTTNYGAISPADNQAWMVPSGSIPGVINKVPAIVVQPEAQSGAAGSAFTVNMTNTVGTASGSQNTLDMRQASIYEYKLIKL